LNQLWVVQVSNIIVELPLVQTWATQPTEKTHKKTPNEKLTQLWVVMVSNIIVELPQVQTWATQTTIKDPQEDPK